MKTITIKVSEELDARLTLRAKRRGVSKSEIAREAIRRDLETNESGEVKEEPSAYDIMKGGCGIIDSGVTDLATNPKHMEGFGQ
ncbi:MAG: ribbon-helix-helix domain-containing protein [Verrucomicrobia bacterium]|nr:ribbon-helix-helix domain-containing protein [Verrucomicrobiota bacterium]MDA1064865.1 ribbon-helix-helix domain-containing protein [Verrucomicrobiota bacterium]